MRSPCPSARVTLAAVLLACAACVHAPPAPAPTPIPQGELPEVICQPCGDFVPHGFACAGTVMVRSDVPRARVAGLKRQCAAAKKRRE